MSKNMPERSVSIGKDFVVNPEGVDPLTPNKEMFGKQIFERGKGSGGTQKEKTTPKKETKKAPEPKNFTKIIENAALKEPILKEIIETTPLKTKKIEEFIAIRLETGKTLRETAQELRKTVVDTNILDDASKLDATKWLTSVATKIGDPDLFIISGEVSSKYDLRINNKYKTIVVPNEPAKGEDRTEYETQKKLQEQQDNLKSNTDIWKQRLDAFPPDDYVARERLLGNIQADLIEGKNLGGKKDTKYSKEQADVVVEKTKLQLEQMIAEEEAKKARENVFREIKSETKQTTQDQKREEQIAVQEEEYSTIRLERSTEVWVEIDPTKATQDWLIEFYKPFGFPGGGEDEAQHRIRQYLGWMKSPSYQKEYFALRREFGKHLERLPGSTKDEKIAAAKKYLKENFDPNNSNIVLSREERDEFEQMKKEAAEFVERHTNLKMAAAALENGEKIEIVTKFLSEGGDKMWYEVASANNGDNGLAYNIYCHNLDVMRGTNTNALRRLGPTELRRAKELTIAEIAGNADMARRFGKKNGELLDYYEAEYLFNIGRSLAKVRQKTALAMLKAAGPSDQTPEGVETLFSNVDWEDKSSFIDASSDEAIAAAMDWVRYFTEKWHNLSPGQQRMLNDVYEFAAIDAGFELTVNQEIKDMKQNKTYKATRDKALEKAWGKNLEGLKATSRPRMINRDKEYKKMLLAEKGKTVFNEVLEMYDHDSSAWRGESILAQISAMYKDGHTIGLGFWVRRIGNEFLTARAEEADKIFERGSASEQSGRNKKIKNSYWESVRVQKDPNNKGEHFGLSVREVLNLTANYRPQALALEHYERNNQEFNLWLQKQETQALITRLGIDPSKGFAEVNNQIMRHYLMIEDKLATEALPNINYNGGLTGVPVEHQARIKEILVETVPDKQTIVENATTGKLEIQLTPLSPEEKIAYVDAYMEFMQKLSVEVGTENLITAFKRPDYRHFFKRTQWTDDARFVQLENPSKQPIKTSADAVTMLTDIARARIPLSEQLTYEGEGRRSPIARTWGDFMVGKELIGIVRDALTTDQKALFKCFEEIKKREDIYAGVGSTLRSSMYIAAGWLKTAMTDQNILGFLELGFLPNSSEQKRFFGNKGNSLGKSKLDDVIDSMDQIWSKLQLHPNMKQTVFKMEKFIGLADEIKIFGRSIKLGRDNLMSPLWRKRYALFATIIGTLMVIEGFKTAKSQLEDKK